MVRRVGWEIMWDNCWIALASGNQKGGREKKDAVEEDSAGAEGGWVRWLQGFSTVVGGELRGWNYYESRQVKLD